MNLTVVSPNQDTYPIYYKSTYFSPLSLGIQLQGSYNETTIVSNGVGKKFEFPVGFFEFASYNPFYGIKEARGKIRYPGEIVNIELVFDEASTVTGALFDVDGVTPLPGFEVELHSKGLLPQKQMTDALGGFRYELVPPGPVAVTAAGLVGSVERVGQSRGIITGNGQILELQVQMKAQGTVKGQIVEMIGEDQVPVVNAKYRIQENSYPYRSFPAQDWFTTDNLGRYEQSNIFAGGFTVMAADPNLARGGRLTGEITADWQILTMENLVFAGEIGSMALVVRDPITGAPVPDCTVQLSHGSFETPQFSTTDVDGRTYYLALPVGGAFGIYAFHAPTGRSGRVGNVVLPSSDEELTVTLYLDIWGRAHGTLFDPYPDPGEPQGVPGGVIQLAGHTASGHISAMATTADDPAGNYEIPGLPEGDFTIAAGLYGSPRRASAGFEITADSPSQQIDLFLEPQQDLFFGLFEKLSSGIQPISPVDGSFAVTLAMDRPRLGKPPSYQKTKTITENGLYRFEETLPNRNLAITVAELQGELRSAAKFTGFGNNIFTNPVLDGAGTFDDPFRIVLEPKGIVTVHVIGPAGEPVAGANVTLRDRGQTNATITDGNGSRTFYAVAEGGYSVAATANYGSQGGSVSDSIVFDDEIDEHIIQLNPTVSAQGVVYQPVPGDVWDGNPATLAPMAGATVMVLVGLTPLQTTVTDSNGVYRFDALQHGAYVVSALSSNGQARGDLAVELVGDHGSVIQVDRIILDGGPPRIISSMPSPGMEDVSLTATIEIVFSEPLADAVNLNLDAFFSVESEPGVSPLGAWTKYLDPSGQQVVRFVLQTEPTAETYQNFTTYSVLVKGGSSGVCDRADRPLTENPVSGWNFTTSDKEGPAVVATAPELDDRIDPVVPIRFDFNKAVVISNEQLDGIGDDDAAFLHWGEADGNGGQIWNEDATVPVSLYLTRNGYSLVVDPFDNFSYPPEAVFRRITIIQLPDELGNLMEEPYIAIYRVPDDVAPVIDDVAHPAQLIQGMAYSLEPQISSVDGITAGNRGGDIDRVDYFFEEPGPPEALPQPGFSATEHPFTLDFVAAMTLSGEFPVWVRAVDTSGNWSNTVLVEMTVVDNQSPVIAAVTVSPANPYAGSEIVATVAGLEDDGNRLTVAAEFWKQGDSDPLASIPGVVLQRGDDEWADLPPFTFSFTIPIAMPELSQLFVRATATDMQGAATALDSATLAVADDQVEPDINALKAVRSSDGMPASLFYVGESLRLEMRVSDLETAVQHVEVEFVPDAAFPGDFAYTQVATLVAGTGNLYRTPAFAVPADIGEIEVTVTASAVDYGANTGASVVVINFSPVPDSSAPTVEWLTPWEGAAWPAEYYSQISNDGAVLLLRIRAQDTADDGGLDPEVSLVEFFVPVVGSGGEIELSTQAQTGEQVPGTDIWQFAFNMPDNIPPGTDIPFAARAVDNASLDVRRDIRLETRMARLVVEGAETTSFFDDGMPITGLGGDPNGPIFILDGGTLSLAPNSDGSIREVPSVTLYAGYDTIGGNGAHGSRLTAPKVTTYSTNTKYYPFELAISEELAIGHGCRIDLEGRGLLGNTGTIDEPGALTALLPGQTGPEIYAGGSHGGRGGYGNWDSNVPSQPAKVYDSIRQPALPGIGGWLFHESLQADGGGVITLHAGGATLKLVGDIVADGLAGPSYSGSGAGGSVYMEIGTLSGQGLITANGGSGGTAGGGGGRIALYARNLGATVDLSSQLRVRGGSAIGHLAGAGTVYYEALDPITGEGSGIGELLVSNTNDPLSAAYTPLPALGRGAVTAVDSTLATVTLDITSTFANPAGERIVLTDESGVEIAEFQITTVDADSGNIVLTVDAPDTELQAIQQRLDNGEAIAFAGRNRFMAVNSSGTARLVIGDDIEIGPAAGPTTINDRNALIIIDDARVVLPGEAISLTATVAPEAGSEIRVGSQVSISWTADDPLGFKDARLSWTFNGGLVVDRFTDQRQHAASNPAAFLLSVPPDAEPGVAELELLLTTLDGRTEGRSATWTVLANNEPTGLIVFDGPSTVQAGFSTTIMVQAEDLEGLASVTLNASGPAVQSQQNVGLSGTNQSQVLTVAVDPAADGATNIELSAVIVDISGATFSTNTLVIDVVPDENAPIVSIEVSPVSDDDIYTSGDDLNFVISATDDVAVSALTVTLDGDLQPYDSSPVSFIWEAPIVEFPTDFKWQVQAIDPSGNPGSAMHKITVVPFENPNAPDVNIV